MPALGPDGKTKLSVKITSEMLKDFSEGVWNGKNM